MMKQLSFTDFHKQLINNNYICSTKQASQYYDTILSDTNKGAILTGQSGAGKTYLPTVLATILDAKLFYFQCFSNTREDDLLVKIVPDDSTISGIKTIDSILVQAIKYIKSGGKAIIVLDEWDKTRPSADAFLLDFVENKRISYNNLELHLTNEETANLAIYLTMNDERDVSEPLLTRLPKIDFKPLSPTFVKTALLNHFANSEFEQQLIDYYITICINLYFKWLYLDIMKPLSVREMIQFIKIAIQKHDSGLDIQDTIFNFMIKEAEIAKQIDTLSDKSFTEISENVLSKFDEQDNSILDISNEEVELTANTINTNTVNANTDIIKLATKKEIPIVKLKPIKVEYIEQTDDITTYNSFAKKATCIAHDNYTREFLREYVLLKYDTYNKDSSKFDSTTNQLIMKDFVINNNIITLLFQPIDLDFYFTNQLKFNQKLHLLDENSEGELSYIKQRTIPISKIKKVIEFINQACNVIKVIDDAESHIYCKYASNHFKINKYSDNIEIVSTNELSPDFLLIVKLLSELDIEEQRTEFTGRVFDFNKQFQLTLETVNVRFKTIEHRNQLCLVVSSKNELANIKLPFDLKAIKLNIETETNHLYKIVSIDNINFTVNLNVDSTTEPELLSKQEKINGLLYIAKLINDSATNKALLDKLLVK